MAKDINIGGRLHSIATGNVIAGADEILDDNLGKKQTQINTETYSLVESVNNALAELNPDQQEALAVAAKANANEAKLGYYICDTAAATAAKTISATGYVLTNGGSMKIKMTNANTADNATLNINSTGAKALYYAGKRASANNSWEAGETVEVYYDGTSFYANNVAGGGSSAPTFRDIPVTAVGKYIHISGDSRIKQAVVSENYQYAIYPCNEGDKILITGAGGNIQRLWAFADSETAILSRAEANVTEKDLVLVAPAGTAMIAINNNNAIYPNPVWKTAKAGTDGIQILENSVDIKEIEGFIERINTPLFNQIIEEYDTSNLSTVVSPINSTAISIQNTDEQEYTITNTTKTTANYAEIIMPTLVVGRKYHLQFTYSCNSTGNNIFYFINGRGTRTSEQYILEGDADELQFATVFTFTGSQLHLRFFSNNMVSGSVLTIKSFKLIAVDSFEGAINRIEYLEGQDMSDATGSYAGTRIKLKKEVNYFKAVPVFSSVGGGQCLAMFEKYIFRAGSGGTCQLYEIVGDTTTRLWTSTISSMGHCNSAQFSPVIVGSNAFPYLYVSLISELQGCSVCSITTTGIEVIQTITLDSSSELGSNDINVQIGDDGYLYAFNTAKVWKLRCPAVTEGDTMLTDSDVIDSFTLDLPAATYYPFQGGIIKDGKLFMLIGNGSVSRHNYLVVIDLNTHNIMNTINIDSIISGEPEDCDIVDSHLYIAPLNGDMYQVDFL